MNDKKMFNSITQVAIPTMTLGAQLAVSLKVPERGLIIGLLAQPFWLYSSWKSYRQVGQIGIFINSVIFVLLRSSTNSELRRIPPDIFF